MPASSSLFSAHNGYKCMMSKRAARKGLGGRKPPALERKGTKGLR